MLFTAYILKLEIVLIKLLKLGRTARNSFHNIIFVFPAFIILCDNALFHAKHRFAVGRGLAVLTVGAGRGYVDCVKNRFSHFFHILLRIKYFSWYVKSNYITIFQKFKAFYRLRISLFDFLSLSSSKIKTEHIKSRAQAVGRDTEYASNDGVDVFANTSISHGTNLRIIEQIRADTAEHNTLAV